jgi:hypothetical protein
MDTLELAIKVIRSLMAAFASAAAVVIVLSLTGTVLSGHFTEATVHVSYWLPLLNYSFALFAVTVVLALPAQAFAQGFRLKGFISTSLIFALIWLLIAYFFILMIGNLDDDDQYPPQPTNWGFPLAFIAPVAIPGLLNGFLFWLIRRPDLDDKPKTPAQVFKFTKRTTPSHLA